MRIPFFALALLVSTFAFGCTGTPTDDAGVDGGPVEDAGDPDGGVNCRLLSHLHRFGRRTTDQQGLNRRVELA